MLLPWQFWRNRETLEVSSGTGSGQDNLTVLIPARNEAAVIATTLDALSRQAPGLRVIVVDDQSDDGTAEIVHQVGKLVLDVVSGKPLPRGWSGKLWALEQGLSEVKSDLVLLLDADIELRPGMLATLLAKMERENHDFISIMALLRAQSFWERMLIPAFVYFFKFIYPFALANTRSKWFAAAAGGCILVKTSVLRDCGAFSSLKGALIDDCTLATHVKRRGYQTWIGLSHGVISHRAYDELTQIWDMVARTAFTQLRYSGGLLALCTGLLMEMFWVPVIALMTPGLGWVGTVTMILMGISFAPINRFYSLSGWRGALLPLVGTFYMGMTWHSAWRYWRGESSRWKGRAYGVDIRA